jgi:hypothetical protein
LVGTDLLRPIFQLDKVYEGFLRSNQWVGKFLGISPSKFLAINENMVHTLDSRQIYGAYF